MRYHRVDCLQTGLLIFGSAAQAMDEGSYWARVQRVAQMMDIRTAFVTDTQLTSAVDLVNRSANGDTSIPLPELAQARKIKDAIVHPGASECKIFTIAGGKHGVYRLCWGRG